MNGAYLISERMGMGGRRNAGCASWLAPVVMTDDDDDDDDDNSVE